MLNVDQVAPSKVVGSFLEEKSSLANHPRRPCVVRFSRNLIARSKYWNQFARLCTPIRSAALPFAFNFAALLKDNRNAVNTELFAGWLQKIFQP